MNQLFYSAIGAFAALAGGSACAASFASQPILVLGDANVDATATSNSGTIIGTVTMSGSGISGFVLTGSSVALLGSSAFPTAVNDSGTVIGFTSSTGFLWRNGAFNKNVNFPISIEGNMLPRPQINRRGEVAYTSFAATALAYAGAPTAPRMQKQLSQQYANVSSINDSGTIAGTELAEIQGVTQPMIFVGRAGVFDLLTPSFGANVSGGFVNNAGQVALSNSSQAYLYDPLHAIYTPLPMPAPAINVQVQGLNNNGRLAGTYADSSSQGSQHVFYSNGTQVFEVGAYPLADRLHVSINDRNVLTVSDTSAQTGASGSAQIRCTGTGC